MKQRLGATLVALLMVAPLSVTAQTTIGAPNDGGTVSSWGATQSSSIFGQTITAPTDNVLNSFSFWLGGGTADVGFSAYVYEYSAALSRATGSALFASTGLTYTPASMSQYTFNTGSLSLNAGSVYVMFLHAVSGGRGVSFNRSVANYTGGNFVNNNWTTEAEWTSNAWESPFDGNLDLRFEAQFSPAVSVPEPGAYLLMLTGLLGLGFVAYQRREELA